MGVFERDRGSGVWWVRYTGSDGKIHRERVGSKTLAKQIYAKRKTQVREQHFVGPQRQHVLFSVTVDKYVLRKQNGWRSPALWLRCAKRWKERFGNRTLASITRADIQVRLNNSEPACLPPASIANSRF